MRYTRYIVALGLAVVLSAHADNKESTFDADLNGWVLTGNGTLSHRSISGNPGGYAHWTDQSGPNGDGWAVAPSKFLGSWHSFTNLGVLKWDHSIVHPGNGTTFLNGRAEIGGPGGSAYYQSSVQMNTNWTTFSVPIRQPSWSMTAGTWTALISDVTDLKIRLEAVWGGTTLDQDGIDNVLLGITNEVTVNIATAVEIFFASVSGATHQVQYSADLINTNWIDLGPAIPGDGTEKNTFDSTRHTTNRFYRVTTE